MSHFEKSLLDADPEAAARLAEMLHGTGASGASRPAPPSLAERFGAPTPAPTSEPGLRPARGGARPRRGGPRARIVKALVTP
ncbi:hypothetical protein [Methylobacterium oxalidis]|uniref:Uncharacterized protein n=1 Tax=Methylobacterium oxalidis TaxID=944322 RepID=A0A512J0H8_9HYPH|nr:hypothetical protein [Methylobacterium oxalidis]GEP03490.1 hypothetical protein MOX02_15280 [Methylobacterium oxalidis]GJE30074.1 hypothetical protein LDDCCGHA_0237 [Methylobacterium oxalidis]GLS66591.1 hypothetical protein GCM10007888_49740 [Methylobacterium oxalidis]